MPSPSPEPASPSIQTHNKEDDSDEYDAYVEILGIAKKTLIRDTSLEYWTDTIDLSKSPSVIQLQSYAACAIAELRTAKRTGARALEAFQEDFHGWELEHFSPLSRAIKRELEQVLYDKGIIFAKGQTIAHSMYNIVCGTAEITFSYKEGDRAQSLTHATLTRESILRETKEESKPFQQAPPQTLIPRMPSYNERTRTIPTSEPTNPYGVSTSLHQTPIPMPVRPTPFQLPPVREYVNEKLAPEKIVQFQKAWKKENNYTGRPYDILADKTMIFIDLCRRLDIEEASYADVFPDILTDRAHMHYLHNIGPGHTWKSLYEHPSRHFNTNVNHNQYWTDWTTMTFARCRQENPDKSLHEVLEAIIDKLTLAQRALGREFQGEIPLHTAVVRACRGQPELDPFNNACNKRVKG